MRLLIKMLAHLAVPIVIGAFALLFFLIYNYHNIFFPIFGVFVLILIIGGAIYEFMNKGEDKKERQRKNTRDVKKILEEGKRHDKNPILYYREIIKSEKYRKTFDKKIKSKEYKKILKNLKRGKSSRSLLKLALKIRAQEPDIMKRVERLLGM